MKKTTPNLTEFRRAYADPQSERLRISLENSAYETHPPQLSEIEGKTADVFEQINKALEPDLSGYVPSFTEALGWANGILPDGAFLETRDDRFQAAIEDLETLPFYDEIPEELLDWCKNRDWNEPFDISDISAIPRDDKTGNLLVILSGMQTAYVGTFEGSIDSLVEEETPEDGQHWHAALTYLSLYSSTEAMKRLFDSILTYCSGIDDFDDPDLLDKMFLEFAQNSDNDRMSQGIFSAGWLMRDYWWRQTHGEAAKAYYDRIDAFSAQDEGRAQGTASTKEKAQRARQKLQGLILQALGQRGFGFALAPISIQAATIRDIAEKNFHEDFEFRKGELLSEKWFEARLEDMKASGDLARLAEQALSKA